MATTTPYSTAVALMTGKPTWLNTYDAERLGSYIVYDDMYHSNPGSFALMIRGSDELPVYMPTAKSLINTLARYVGRDFNFSVSAKVGSPADIALATTTMTTFFARERIRSQFVTAKKEMLRFGDAFWYLFADDEKPEGNRISIKTVDPSLMFPITADDDVDRIVGYDMVEKVTIDDEERISIQRWLKNTADGKNTAKAAHPFAGRPDAPVWYQKLTMDVEDWETAPKGVQKLADEALADGIIQLPIYHWKNNEETGNPFGSSELRSLERVIAAVNQAVTDEDLALALAGLGVWSTKGGGPADGGDWIIGPGEVIEDEDFKRIPGISSVTPSQDHIKYLEAAIDKTVGITDVTRGAVSAEVAESGIALAIRMAPTLDTAAEKNLVIKSVMDQLLFDLKAWFAAYEGLNFVAAEITSVFGDSLPRNRKDELTELDTLLTAGIISKRFYRQQLIEKFGYTFDLEEMTTEVDTETKTAEAAADPYGDRLTDPDGNPLVDGAAADTDTLE